MNIYGGWLVEIDIRRFFDTLDRSHLRTILRQRVRDGVLLRLIDKWLKAGVLESGNLHYPDAGTPQGGVISPLLANIYLHEVSCGTPTMRSCSSSRRPMPAGSIRPFRHASPSMD